MCIFLLFAFADPPPICRPWRPTSSSCFVCMHRSPSRTQLRRTPTIMPNPPPPPFYTVQLRVKNHHWHLAFHVYLPTPPDHSPLPPSLTPSHPHLYYAPRICNRESKPRSMLLNCHCVCARCVRSFCVRLPRAKAQSDCVAWRGRGSLPFRGSVVRCTMFGLCAAARRDCAAGSRRSRRLSLGSVSSRFACVPNRPRLRGSADVYELAQARDSRLGVWPDGERGAGY